MKNENKIEAAKPRMTNRQSVAFFNRDGSERTEAQPFVKTIAGQRKKLGEALRSGLHVLAAREEMQKIAAGAEWLERAPPKTKKRPGRKLFAEEFLSSRFDVQDFGNDFGTTHIREYGDDGSTGTDIFGTRIDLANLGWYWDTWAEATDDGKIKKLETYQDVNSSKIGGFLRAENFSPDGRDDIWGHAEGGLWWNYMPSRDCRLEIRALVVETYSRSLRKLSDQWGQVSNCYANQGNFLTCGYFQNGFENYGKVFRDVGPGSTYQGDGEHSQDDSSQWGTGNSYLGYPDADILSRGNGRTLEVAIYPIGQMFKDQAVTCFLGARSQMNASLDDVTAELWQGGTWKIINLFVREI